MKSLLTLVVAASFLLGGSPTRAGESRTADPRTLAATATAEGGHTITGGEVVMTFAADGRPLSFTRRNGPNLVRQADPGPGFFLTSGSGAPDDRLPLSTWEIKDNTLVASAGPDGPRVTFTVTAGRSHIAFRIKDVANIPAGDQPVLGFQANFDDVRPEVVPLDYMTVSRGEWASRRSFIETSWPYLWRRSADDPFGGFAFFIPLDDDDHNESLLRIWTEENLPHPRITGDWTLDRARRWVQEWQDTFARADQLIICAQKPEDLDVLVDYAKALQVRRLYLHTDTWRGAYWVYDRDPLHVNRAVFPRGEADLKAFNDRLKAEGMDAMLHTICYGFGPSGSKYVGEKVDRRLANWGRGKLEKAVGPSDTTILFRPDPGVRFPTPAAFGSWWKFNDVLIGDEIVRGTFTDTDRAVWTLTGCQRGAHATAHEAGTEAIGLLKAYDQNYYPSSSSTLCEETAREYAEFFNRLGIRHHEYDGGECHCDVPWGFDKWAMFVYRHTDHPVTSNSSSGRPNPWDLVYRFKADGASIMERRGGGIAALAIDRESRLATSPIENHFTLARGAAALGTAFSFQKPEPMFGIAPETIQEHGLSPLIAEQFLTWRNLAGALSPEQRRQIFGALQHDQTPFPLDAGHPIGTTVFEARRTATGFELQPFVVMVRGKADVEWKTVQEFGVIPPRQYVLPGMPVRLENPFHRQAPQFIIRVMHGVVDAAAIPPHGRAADGGGGRQDRDTEGYLVGAGAKGGGPSERPSDGAALITRLQPSASLMKDSGRHRFRDVGPALEVSYDNALGDEVFLPTGLPSHAIKGDARRLPGLGLTVTGDGSGAFLLVQVGPDKDYVIPVDFTGRREIVIPSGEVARTVGRWGMRYRTKSAGYGVFRDVSIGFGRVMAKTHPTILMENLRLLGARPSSIHDPVIHAGDGVLAIKGEVRSDHYLWYRGGQTVGLYDLNWRFVANLPAVPTRYEVDKGPSEFRIEGRCGESPPWLDVQFIVRGDASPVTR